MYRVLIADDEEKVCRLIFGLVDWGSLGLEVVGTVHDGLAAREAIREARPDIVITDIRMPGCTGLDLIRDAKAESPDTDFIIVSGYRHFDYAHTAIKYGVEDYLLKPLKRQELLDTLQKLLQKRRSAALEADEAEMLRHQAQADGKRLHATLLAALCGSSGVGAPRDLAELNATYRLRCAEGRFFALCLKADIGWAPEDASLQSLMLEKIARIALGKLSPVAHDTALAALPGGVYGILCAPPETLREVPRALAAIVDERAVLRELCPSLHLTLGVSEADGVPGLHAAMRQATEAAAERIVQGSDRVLHHHAPETNAPPLAAALPPEARRALQTALETQDADAYHAALGAVCDAVTRAQPPSGAFAHAVCAELVALHRYALQSAEPAQPSAASLQERFARRFDQCFELAQALDMTRALLLEDLRAHIDEHKNQESRPIRQAKQVIRDRYREPLTLEIVSQEVGFHPAYFSTLFKKVTGENFLEYLSGVRIEAAKQLLMDGRLSVADIAERVGYSDIKYFTKLFKKLMGLTPSEYRKLYY